MNYSRMRNWTAIFISSTICVCLHQAIAAPSDFVDMWKLKKMGPPISSRADSPPVYRVEPQRNPVPSQEVKFQYQMPHAGRAFTYKQVEAKYKHAPDFGITDSISRPNILKFQAALQSHCATASKIIRGRYNGAPAVHFLDEQKKLNVVFDRNGSFWTTYRLTDLKMKRLIETGDLGK